MNKPITLCDRCKENARCCLNYDGDNCRRARTVEPTNADRIRSMTDGELADLLHHWWLGDTDYFKTYCFECKGKYPCHDDCLLKQEG